MKPLQCLIGHGHVLLAGTMRTGKSALLTQLMQSAIDKHPPVLPAAQLPRPLPRTALEQGVQAWTYTSGKDPL